MFSKISSKPVDPIKNVPQTEVTPSKTVSGGTQPRSPQQVLAESKQTFPQVDKKMLQGGGLPPMKGSVLSSVSLGVAPRKGEVAILLGTGDTARVAIMPTKGVPGKNQGAAILKLVAEGQALFNQIMNNEKAPRGKEQIAKLMWFLQALGSSKAAISSGGGPKADPALFKEGAFSIADPDRRLESYLRDSNSYGRSSSHLKKFQKIPDCKARGVDVRGVCTPNARKTVLFARMPDKTDAGVGGAPHMGEKFLFLKMEPHGCRGLSKHGTGGPNSTTGDGKSARRFFANLKDWIGHLGGFLKSSGQRSGAAAIVGQNNRERIPKNVKKQYKKLMEKSTKLLGGKISALGKDKPLSSTGGIRVMIRNLENALKETRDNPRLDNKDKLLNGKTVRQNMVDTLALLRTHGDHLEHRFGSEVIFTSDELNLARSATITAPSGKEQSKSSSVQTPSKPVITPPTTSTTASSTTTPPISTSSTTTPPISTSSSPVDSSKMSTTSRTLHTPGVSIQPGGVMTGTPVAFTADMGSRMSQKMQTCFMVSVMRGLVSKELGREHLSGRVSQQGGDYYVRLTHNNADHVVKVPADSLAAYKNMGQPKDEKTGQTIPDNRPDPIHALECALVNFMQTNNIDNYTYGETGDPSVVAGLLGLGEILEDSIDFTSDQGFSASLQDTGNTDNKIMTLVAPKKHSVGTMSGNHVVGVRGTTEGGNVAIMDSLNLSSTASLPLGTLRQAILDGNASNSDARWQVSVFTIPANPDIV